MKIYVGVARPSGGFVPFALLIQWIECRNFDHVYIRLPEPMSQEYMIFQASKEMVNMYNKDIWLESNTSVREYEFDISDAQYQWLWGFVKANLGIPYSLKEDLGILLMKVFKMKQIFNDGYSAEFCSKMGAIICQNLGVKLPEDPGSIDPSGLDTILANAGLPSVDNPSF